MRRSIVCCLVVALLAAAPTRAAAPIQLMGYLVGTWNCTADMAGTKRSYRAQWAYAQGGTWLRETVSAGSGDESAFTYVSQDHLWRSVVTARAGAVTVFQAPDTGLAHLAYRSVYPDAGASVTFDRISDRAYTLHLKHVAGGTTTSETDGCTKAPAPVP